MSVIVCMVISISIEPYHQFRLDMMGNREYQQGEGEQLLSPRQLADYLNVPLATLYAWRYHDEGPPGFRVGKHVRYRWNDVQVWVQDQLETRRPPRS